MYGLLTIITYLNSISEYSNQRAKITIYCDNQAAIDFCSSPYIGTTPKWSDSRNIDLKMEIQRLISTTKNKYKFLWVASHQDEKTEFSDLSHHAQLNVLCDKAASKLT